MLQILIRFSMNIPLNSFKLSFTVTWFTIKSLWRLICSSWAQVDSNHRPRAYQARALTSWAMSPQAASVVCIYDGDDGIRTHDPLLAGQVLSQLSYTPIGFSDLFSLSMSLSLTENWTTIFVPSPITEPRVRPVQFSLERRWSSRTFRYGYLVTT